MEEINKVEDLLKKANELASRRESLVQGKAKVEGQLSQLQKELKKCMDEAKEEGYDPNDLKEELKKAVEVAEIKLNNLEADIEAGEKILSPMLNKINA